MIETIAGLLSQAQLKRVHEASCEILDNVGLEVHNEEARALYAKHGCKVDNKTLRVTIPQIVIDEFLQMTPNTFTYHARNPELNKTIPNRVPLTLTASSAPYIIDPETNVQRRSTSADIAKIAKLINNLEGVDLFSVSVLAEDAAPGYYSLARFYTALKYCEKPIRGSGDPGVDCEKILEFAYTLAGSEAAYKENPFITHHYCPVISPLKMDEASTELMMFYAEQGLPSHPTIVPNGGLTSPLTLLGTLAQGNAEFLACMALMQMVKAGTPLVYSNLSTTGDMRSGAYTPGAIECGILNMGHAQLAKYYNVPSSGYIGLTNSKLVDAQAGYEKGLSCMGAALAGLDVLQYVGLIDALMAFDYKMAVIDNEIAIMIKRTMQGIHFSEDDFALDEVSEVGPGGRFITSPRTLDLMEKGVHYPDVANRETRQVWAENGSLSSDQAALNTAREILSQDTKTFISQDEDNRIRARFADLVSGDFELPPTWKN